MQMLIAGLDQLEKVYNIVRTTIEEVYPHYYPAGAVTFFLSHHQRSHIEEDLRSASVYLFAIDGQAFATCTVRGNELCRFFVLPPYQGQGYGREQGRAPGLHQHLGRQEAGEADDDGSQSQGQ